MPVVSEKALTGVAFQLALAVAAAPRRAPATCGSMALAAAVTAVAAAKSRAVTFALRFEPSGPGTAVPALNASTPSCRAVRAGAAPLVTPKASPTPVATSRASEKSRYGAPASTPVTRLTWLTPSASGTSASSSSSATPRALWSASRPVAPSTRFTPRAAGMPTTRTVRPAPARSGAPGTNSTRTGSSKSAKEASLTTTSSRKGTVTFPTRKDPLRTRTSRDCKSTWATAPSTSYAATSMPMQVVRPAPSTRSAVPSSTAKSPRTAKAAPARVSPCSVIWPVARSTSRWSAWPLPSGPSSSTSSSRSPPSSARSRAARICHSPRYSAGSGALRRISPDSSSSRTSSASTVHSPPTAVTHTPP